MADLNAALVQQFLDVSITEGKAVVEPLWACWMMVMGKRAAVVYGVRSGQDTVAVRLGVGHGGSAYPNTGKATQPVKEINDP